MFDWARGSLLQRLVDAGVYGASWDSLNAAWLKNWSTPWFFGAMEFRRDLKVLDVGSSTPALAQYLVDTYGCRADVLDVAPGDGNAPHFGLPESGAALFPGVRQHVGLAGQDLLESETYDIVYCNSVIEHTYDTTEALDPANPLAHINVLRDLVRMLRPGGLLLMNWDIYLDGVPHQMGWDYESDFWILHSCGMRLADPRRRVRSARYIYDHPDSLFFSAEAMLPFMAGCLPHGASINAIWTKPGAPLVARLLPYAHLIDAYLPADETDRSRAELPGTALSTTEIDIRFRRHMELAHGALGGTLFANGQ